MHPYRTSDKTDNIKLSLKTRILSHRAAPILTLIVIPVLGAMILYGTGVLGCAIAHEHYSYAQTTVFGLVILSVGVFVGGLVWLVTVGLYRVTSEAIAIYVVNDLLTIHELSLLSLKQLENLHERCKDHASNASQRIIQAQVKKWNYTCTPTDIPKEQ